MVLSFWLSHSLSLQNPLLSHLAVSKRAKTTQEEHRFLDKVFLLLPSRGRCISPNARGKPGYHETVAGQPRVHTPRDGPGSRQHGGARHLLGLFTKRVSHLRVAADPAPALYCDFEVAPGIEGELSEPTASLGRPRGLVAPRSILWAAGRKKPTPGHL